MPLLSTDMQRGGGGGNNCLALEVPHPAPAANMRKGKRSGALWLAPPGAGFAAKPMPPAANCAMATAATSL